MGSCPSPRLYCRSGLKAHENEGTTSNIECQLVAVTATQLTPSIERWPDQYDTPTFRLPSGAGRSVVDLTAEVLLSVDPRGCCVRSEIPV